MPGLAPFAWRSLAARPVRTILTVLGIALGVAVLAAALVTSEGIDAAVDRTVIDVAGRADLRISAFSDAGISDTSAAAVDAIPGVSIAAPTIERRTYAIPKVDGTTWTDDPVAVLGIDPVLDPHVRDLGVIRGSSLARPDEPSALISETLAAASGLDVGSELELYGSADALPEAGALRVVGILRGDGPLVGAGGRVVVVPLGTARSLFTMKGVSRLDLVLQPGASLASVEAALPAAIGQPYVISTPDDLAASLRASTTEFRATMALVAAAALFAGAFLIFNTLSMTVTERIREVALLRAAGATRGQVTRVVLLEAGVLGVAGGILGVVLGVVLAILLGSFVRAAFGLRTSIEPSATGLALVGIIGLLVTLAAAVEPARRAGGVAPAVALRARAEPGPESRARLRWLVVVAAVVAATGVLLWPGETAEAGIVRPLAVYGLFLLVALITPFLLEPLGRIAGIPFAAVLRVEERLARGSLVRDRGRTALTVGALAVGLGLVVAIGTVAADARRAATDWIEGVIPGDELLTTVSPVDTGPDGPGPEIAAIAGVQRVSPIATFPLAFRGVRIDAAAVDGTDLADDGRLSFTAGDRAAALKALDAGGSVILPAAQAQRLALGLGDTMTLAASRGAPISLTVVGIVERGMPGSGGEAILVGWPDATRFGVTGADALAVRFLADGPGTPSRSDSMAAVADAARELGLQPVPLDRVEGAISDALGRVFGLFDLLALVAVVVAALGIVNTLTMDVLERVREIGILRAAGMTRRQVSRMVVVEAGVLGVIGAILGIGSGLLAAIGMLVLGGSRDIAGLAVPWPTIGLAFVLGVGLAMLAAYYPARVAGRLSIVRAVQVE